jgi:hypothetical protein
MSFRALVHLGDHLKPWTPYKGQSAFGTVRVADGTEIWREGVPGVTTTLGKTTEGLLKACATRFCLPSMYLRTQVHKQGGGQPYWMWEERLVS